MVNILLIIGLLYLPLISLSCFKERFKTKFMSIVLIVMASIMALGYLYIGFYEPFYLFLSLIWCVNIHMNYKSYKLLSN